MTYSIRQANYSGSSGYKTVMALAFTALIGGLSMAPVFAAGGGGNGWQQDRKDDGGHGWQQNRKDNEHRRFERHGAREGYGYHPVYRSPYYYSQPVYVPPPVYYEPQPSPGISLFFPFDFRR
jgi:hypothetical protein